ncbi:MAG: hypothetical protein Q9227_005351 [Pyrenula ochraceoflavens]
MAFYLSLCLVLFAVSPALVSVEAHPARAQRAQAIYFMSNQATNSILSVPIAKNGTLMDGRSINTGGAGANLIDSMTGQPAAPDALASQGSVTIAGNMLFAVNAGSNTASMFKINENDPTQLMAVGSAAQTMGDFPVSIAVAKNAQIACVAHTGSNAGVSCSNFDAQTGFCGFDAVRPFALGQTDPPTGPLNDVAHTFFDEKEQNLITTVKGDPTKNNTGFVSTFKVSQGAVDMKGQQTSPNGTAVLFGTKQIPNTNRLLATDASFGFTILDMKNLAQPIAMTAVSGQKATCWATISPATGTGFVTDVGVNSLVEADLKTGGIVKEVQPDNGNPGMIDLVAAGSMVYALSPGNGTTPASIAVFDVSGGPGSAKAIQNFAVQGADKNSQGMAVF